MASSSKSDPAKKIPLMGACLVLLVSGCALPAVPTTVPGEAPIGGVSCALSAEEGELLARFAEDLVSAQKADTLGVRVYRYTRPTGGWLDSFDRKPAADVGQLALDRWRAIDTCRIDLLPILGETLATDQLDPEPRHVNLVLGVPAVSVDRAFGVIPVERRLVDAKYPVITWCKRFVYRREEAGWTYVSNPGVIGDISAG